MSLNSILRGLDIDVAQILDESKKEVFSTNAEDTLYRQHQILSYENRLNLLKENIEKVSRRKQLFSNDFDSFSIYTNELVKVVLQKIEHLQSLLSTYESEKDLSVESVTAQLKRAERKISYINALKGFFNWVHEEDFINFELINTDNQKTTARIDLEAKEATLPIVEEAVAQIKEISIDAGSNCIVGDPSGGDNKLVSLLTETENTNFSAYTVDSSRCKLNLDIELRKEEVLNNICVFFSNKNSSQIDSVKEIYFYNLNGTRTKLTDLTTRSLDVDTIKNKLERNFLPVKAKRVKIVIEQTNPTFINGVPHYLIDLNYLRFKSIRYEAEATVTSKNINLGNYLALSNSITCYPENSQSYTLDLTLNSGEFSEALEVNTSAYSLKDYLPFFSYSLSIKRKDNISELTTTPTSYYSYDLIKDIYAVELPYQRDVRQGFLQSNVKVAHDFKGVIKSSRSTNQFSVGFNPRNFGMQNSEVFFKFFSQQQESISSTSFFALDTLTKTDDISKVELAFGKVKPKIIQLYEYYFLELPSCFDIDDYSVLIDDEEQEISTQIWEEDNSLKGILFERSQIDLPRVTKTLSEISIGNNSYRIENNSIIRGTLVLKDELGVGFEEKEFIDGISEFSSLSGIFNEGLNSRNVSQGDIIAFEPEETVSESYTPKLYRGSELISNIAFIDTITGYTLVEDTPVIDRSTNVMYLKTSETSFFSNYYIQYKFESIVVDASSYFSVDYSNATIYFSREVDDTKRISYINSGSLEVKFNIVKYLEPQFDGTTIKVYESNPITQYPINFIKIYLPVDDHSVSISGIEDYYSPIISKIEFGAV